MRLPLVFILALMAAPAVAQAPMPAPAEPATPALMASPAPAPKAADDRCTSDCAKRYFFCLAREDGDCAGEWGACRRICRKAEDAPLSLRRD